VLQPCYLHRLRAGNENGEIPEQETIVNQSHEKSFPKPNRQAPGTNVMNPSLNHLKVKTQDADYPSEARARRDQDGGRTGKSMYSPGAKSA
jgi:hypothetical protein